MNAAIHYDSAAQRHADAVREARRNPHLPVLDAPAREPRRPLLWRPRLIVT